VKFEVAVIPAKAGIQPVMGENLWTSAFAEVTSSIFFGPYQ
jgi:hypothetical protein